MSFLSCYLGMEASYFTPITPSLNYPGFSSPKTDLDENGVIDVFDMTIIGANFGKP